MVPLRHQTTRSPKARAAFVPLPAAESTAGSQLEVTHGNGECSSHGMAGDPGQGSKSAEHQLIPTAARAPAQRSPWLYLSSDLWISAIFLSSFSECLGKNWNLEL